MTLIQSIVKVMGEHGGHLGVRDIELQVLVSHPKADTFDVQRAVRSLVDRGVAAANDRYMVRLLACPPELLVSEPPGYNYASMKAEMPDGEKEGRR